MSYYTASVARPGLEPRPGVPFYPHAASLLGRRGKLVCKALSAAALRSLTTNVAHAEPLIKPQERWRRRVGAPYWESPTDEGTSKGLGHTLLRTPFSLELSFLMSEASSSSHCL